MSNEPTVDNSRGDEERKDEARKHAWNYFTVHADQRLKSVNFFLILIAFLTAGFVTALKEQLFGVGGGIAAFALFATYLFYQMDNRNRSLVKLAEAALKPFEEQLAVQTCNNAVRVLELADQNSDGTWTYTKIFRLLYGAAFFLFLMGLLYSLWFAFKTPTNEFALKVTVHIVASLFLCFLGLELLTLEKARREHATDFRTKVLFGFGVATIVLGVISVAYLIFVRMW